MYVFSVTGAAQGVELAEAQAGEENA